MASALRSPASALCVLSCLFDVSVACAAAPGVPSYEGPVLEFLRNYSAFGSIIGSTISAAAAVCIGLWVAKRYTRQIKRVDATLEFNRRFHELRKEQHEINARAKAAPSGEADVSEGWRNEGKLWWHRYFDLMLFQFNFFCEGLVDEKRFAQWMLWRNDEFSEPEASQSKTCGLSYADGWRAFRKLPAMAEDPFIAFLDDIHRADAREIPAIAKRYARQARSGRRGLTSKNLRTPVMRKFSVLKPEEAPYVRQRVQDHAEVLRQLLIASADHARKYLLLTNAGAAIAILTFMNARPQLHTSTMAWTCLGLFSLGVLLVGVLSIFDYHIKANQFTQWINDSARYFGDEIDEGALYARLNDYNDRTAKWPVLAGYGAFVCFLTGAALAIFGLRA